MLNNVQTKWEFPSDQFWKKFEIFCEKVEKNLRFFASLGRIFQFLSLNLHTKIDQNNQNKKSKLKTKTPKTQNVLPTQN
jgi:hypothetical protein